MPGGSCSQALSCTTWGEIVSCMAHGLGLRAGMTDPWRVPDVGCMLDIGYVPDIGCIPGIGCLPGIGRMADIGRMPDIIDTQCLVVCACLTCIVTQGLGNRCLHGHTGGNRGLRGHTE